MTRNDVSKLEQQLSHAIVLFQSGHAEQAESLYRAILLEKPTHPNANHHLGVLLFDTGRVDESFQFFKAALDADPEEEQYWLSYIEALVQARYFEDAQLVLSYGLQAGLAGRRVEVLVAALECELGAKSLQVKDAFPPSFVESELINLFAAQCYDAAEKRVRELVQDYPDWLVGWKILSDVLLVQKKDARLPALRALQLNAEDAKEHCYYGLILKSQGDLKGAEVAFNQAIKLKPDYAAAYNNLGIVEKDMGDIDAGIRNYQRALALNPDYASCYSNMLFCLSHAEHVDAKELFKQHCQFGQQYELPLKEAWPVHTNARDPDRRLRVGFVSADFRDHSLTYFIEPLIKYLSLSVNISLHAYANSAIEDAATQRLQGKFKSWNEVSALSNEMMAEKIREDGIDILVDLDGHTSGNRLLTFAMKPAPIQVSWLGYLATTGLTAMDYYFADSYLAPSGKLDSQFTEKLVQLPANAPFTPFDNSPEVNQLPALNNGYITFACFNRVNKITLNVVRLWSKLLNAQPNSKMLLGGMPQEGSYDALIEWFAQEGVTADRLIFHARGSMETYLKLHQEVDICLDTFPSNGVTTTCHALWMGVPTLCVEGESLMSRGALGVMRHVGMDDFVTHNNADFISKGLYWSAHLHALADVRASLRSRFNQSNLAHPEVIVGGLEYAFSEIWQRWCLRLPPQSFDTAIFSGV